MIIMAQTGLDNINKYLKDRGYHVISEDIKTSYYDIFLYSSSSYEGLYDNLMNNSTFKADNTNNVLMINIHNKTYLEIEEMINRRKYSNLFESEGFF